MKKIFSVITIFFSFIIIFMYSNLQAKKNPTLTWSQMPSSSWVKQEELLESFKNSTQYKYEGREDLKISLHTDDKGAQYFEEAQKLDEKSIFSLITNGKNTAHDLMCLAPVTVLEQSLASENDKIIITFHYTYKIGDIEKFVLEKYFSTSQGTFQTMLHYKDKNDPKFASALSEFNKISAQVKE